MVELVQSVSGVRKSVLVRKTLKIIRRLGTGLPGGVGGEQGLW